MPQTLHVVLCVSCKAFQVQIVKKSSNKWECKLCGTKQSVQQVYHTGTGAECRKATQQLNQARGLRENELQVQAFAQENQESYSGEQAHRESHGDPHFCPTTEHCGNCDSDEGSKSKPVLLQQGRYFVVAPEHSKWRKYLDENNS